MWEQFKEWVDVLANNKVAVIIIASVLALVIFLIIFSKTSIGKKSLKTLKNLYSDLVSKFKDFVAVMLDFKRETIEKVNEGEKKFEELSNKTDEKLAVITLQYESFKKGVYDLLSKVPNAKVQKGLEELKLDTEKHEKYLQAVLGDYYSEIKHLLEEKENEGEKAQNEPIVEEINDGKETKDSN